VMEAGMRAEIKGWTKRILGLIFLAWCIANGCAAESKIFKVTLEEVLSVGSLDDDTLFQWVGVAADADDQIYVTDAMDYSLKKFDAQGQLIRKAGRKGQGPGEFLAPRLLGLSEDYLFVTDQNVPGIQVFNHDLQFIHRLPIKIPVGDIKVLSDGRIAAVALVLNQSGCIHVYDLEGHISNKIQYSTHKEPTMMDWVEIEFDSRSNLYVVYNFQDRVEKFDIIGNKVWSRPILGLKKVKTKKVGPWEVPDKIVFKDVMTDRDDRLYILGGGHSENPSRDVYVLSPQGEHLTTFTLPESSHCIFIDGKNFLYSRANEGITLKKYRMNWPQI
jgi:hypothetical protein